MPEQQRPFVFCLTQDTAVSRLLQQVARDLGADSRCAGSAAAVPPSACSLLCADASLPGLTPAAVCTWKSAPHPPAVLWFSADPRGEGAATALANGAEGIVALPVWEPELRSRLAPYLTMATGPGTQGSDLELLLDSQRALIPLQLPEDVCSRVQDGLERLFPLARVSLQLTENAAPCPERTVEELNSAHWHTANIPLTSGGSCLGVVRVSGSQEQSFPRHKLQLLDVFATQAAQALHRTQLYQALSLGKAEWERTFDTIPDTIALLDPDLRVRRVNRALADSVERAPREMIGRHCYEVLCGLSSRCPECVVPEVLASGTATRWNRDVHRKGRTYQYSAYPLKDVDGVTRQVITYGRDVTREEQLAQGLRQSEKLVTLGQIAAGIAHEINNPLTAISSYAQLLAMRLADPKEAESAKRIQQGTERIHRLVTNLMSFARPEEESFYPLDLNQIVSKALSFSRYEVTRGDTTLVEELQPDLPKVMASEPQLEQLLVNLLTNARDAVGGRGTIHIRTTGHADEVFLLVEDNGVGIGAGELEQIFEPFYTTKPVGKGTGLGLFIAAGIAEKHGGKLHLDSEPGKGTRASLVLPAFKP